MRRGGLLTLAGGVVLALAALVLVAATDERRLAFTLEVSPVAVAAEARPGEEACQRGIEAEAEFDEVDLLLGTFARPGPPLTVTVRRSGSAAVLASGVLPAGAKDNRRAGARLDRRVPEGTHVDVCARNDGSHRVAYYGGSIFQAPSSGFVGSRPAGDIFLVFRRDEPRSVLSLVPEMPRRAAILRPEPLGAWTFWALLAAVPLGLSVLLGLALRRAAD